MLLCYDHEVADLPCQLMHKAKEKNKRLRTPGEKLAAAAAKHTVKEAGCSAKCLKKCTEKITEEHRSLINDEFWSLPYNERKQWMYNNISFTPVKTPTPKKVRKTSLRYKLRDSAGKVQDVCQPFFLTTLGYGKTSNECLKTLTKSTNTGASTVKKDKRGSHEPWHKLPEDEIKSHIMSFNPLTHHYRQEHAPNRLYLPSDITITAMHEHFNETHSRQICYEAYINAVKKLNISFAVLGNEECETCLTAKIHEEENHNSGTKDDCRECQEQSIHLENAKVARELYQEDANKEKVESTVAVSADLQKVIMVPRIPGVKSVAFTKRIIAFNETFALIGKGMKSPRKRPLQKSLLTLWNETTAGRKAEDVASAFWRFISEYRDADEIIIWLDNCTAQNKNYVLFSMLFTAVNTFAPMVITLKYFEAGHTFMSADSVHHGIEQELRRVKNVFDWEDFIQVAASSNSGKLKVHDMLIRDFRHWTDKFNKRKLRDLNPWMYLRDVACIQFHSGDRNLYYKNSHRDEEFQSADLLNQTFKFQVPGSLNQVKGINREKKQSILNNLGKLMPQNRRDFWRNLPETEEHVEEEDG